MAPPEYCFSQSRSHAAPIIKRCFIGRMGGRPAPGLFPPRGIILPASPLMLICSRRSRRLIVWQFGREKSAFNFDLDLFGECVGEDIAEDWTETRLMQHRYRARMNTDAAT